MTWDKEALQIMGALVSACASGDDNALQLFCDTVEDAALGRVFKSCLREPGAAGRGLMGMQVVTGGASPELLLEMGQAAEIGEIEA